MQNIWTHIQKKIWTTFLQSILIFIVVWVIVNIVFVVRQATSVWQFNRPWGVVLEKSFAIWLILFLLLGIPLIYLRWLKRRMIGVVVNDIWWHFSQQVSGLIVGKILEYGQLHEQYLQKKAVSYQAMVRSFPLWLRWIMRALQFFFPVVQAFQWVIEKLVTERDMKKEELITFFHEQMQWSWWLWSRISGWVLYGIVVLHILFLVVVWWML